MNQLYEKKCNCKCYDDLNEHGATLLKMELPEYETAYSGSGYMICRTLRFMGYITVAVLLSYSLWRIHVIESTLLASDHLHNLTRTITLESSRLHHNRVTRSVPVDNHADVNFIGEDKELPRGSMLTAKNEFVPTKRRRPVDEREFEYLVHSLFDKIQTMHNDTDRSHLHNNMKAVFQAWFPVFDALLPEELIQDQLEPLTGSNRSVNNRVERSVHEEYESVSWHILEKNFAISKERLNLILMRIRLLTHDDDKQHNSIKGSINDASSEMYMEQFSNDNEQELIKAEDDKNGKRYSKGEKQRLIRSTAAKISEESSAEKKPGTTRSAADKTSEESSEKKKQRFKRSVSMSSDESKSSSEEEKRRVKYNKNIKSKESSEEEKKKNKSKKVEKSSEESVESSGSAESKEKKDKEKNELFYQVVPSDQDGSKTIIQVD